MHKILLQLDPDPHPSVFDAVVAVDSGVDHLFRHGGVRPEFVRDLIHGALFTRGPGDLKHTAVFVGGSNVEAGDALRRAVVETFFGPFRVSVLFDANGCNTTAAAAVIAAMDGATQTLGSMDGATVAILAATGPVGQRVARLLWGLGGIELRVGSRQLDKAQAVADLERGVSGADLIIAAGAAGITLLPESIWRRSGAQVLIDLNAVPPPGIEGVQVSDRGESRGGMLTWGALGVGRTKMKIHKKAIAELFTSNDRIIDAEECLAIGLSLV
jgi:hypothetical protein